MTRLTRFLTKKASIYDVLIIFGWCAVLLAGCMAQTSNVLVEYSRSGGIANLDDSLIINQDGSVVVTRRNGRCELFLDRGELKLLEETFAAANFAELDRQYLPDNQGADLLQYEIMYDGRAVAAKDGAVPDALWPALELLNQIAARCS